MGMNVGGNKGGPMETSTSHLVDVVLVLLIIFMVVTQMLQRVSKSSYPMHDHFCSRMSVNTWYIIRTPLKNKTEPECTSIDYKAVQTCSSAISTMRM